jgi:uncharacterized phage infection (PIP) family protein YhgE
VQENFEVIDIALDKSESNFVKLDEALSTTEENFKKVDTAMEVSEKNFESIDNALQIFEANTNKLDEALQNIDTNFIKLDTALEHFDESFKQFDTGFETIEENMNVIDESIQSIKLLEESIDEAINYSEKINSNTKAIATSVTKLNTQVKETFESQGQEFNNELNEELGIETKTETELNESNIITPDTTSIDELMNFEEFSDDKITATLEAANNKKANENFVKWPEQTQNLFMELEETQKQKVSTTIIDQKLIEESAIVDVITKITAVPEQPKWLTLAPEKFKGMYESMKPELQGKIGREARFRILEDAYQVKNFWETRTYLNETVTLQDNRLNLNEGKKSNPTKLGYSEEYLNSIVEGLGKYK